MIAPEGRAAIELAKANGSWSALDDVEDMIVPDDLALALASSPGALRNFESFSPPARKAFLRWINNLRSDAKRAERITEIFRLAAEGRRLTD